MVYNDEEDMIRAWYEIEVMEAKSVHGLNILQSHLEYIRAREKYVRVKRDADELYLATRRKLFNRLRKTLYNLKVDEKKALATAERMNGDVNGNGKDKAASVAARPSRDGMEQPASAG